MFTRVHRLCGFYALLALLLAACAPAAANVPVEVTATELPPTSTPLPTATPIPTDTPVPTQAPTHTPTVTATTLPTLTPAPTATLLPPTATPAPQPGDAIYQSAESADWKTWKVIHFGSDNYSVTPDGDSLIMQIDGKQTWVYALYGANSAYPDIQVDVDAELMSGPNLNNLSVVCRYTRAGWYEFNVTSGGMWEIDKYTEAQGYTLLKSGGSTAVKANQSQNHLAAVCLGDSLTLYINGVKVGTAHDNQLKQGGFGMSASTFRLPKVQMRFSNFAVRLADPTGEPLDSPTSLGPTTPVVPAGSLVG